MAFGKLAFGPILPSKSFCQLCSNFPGDHSYSERYKNEYDRLLGVMDRILSERNYLAGDYSIADATLSHGLRHIKV